MREPAENRRVATAGQLRSVCEVTSKGVVLPAARRALTTGWSRRTRLVGPTGPPAHGPRSSRREESDARPAAHTPPLPVWYRPLRPADSRFQRAGRPVASGLATV